MNAVMRYLVAAFIGAFAGYFGLVVLANLEDICFYSIRTMVTGETALSRIIEHPADRWISPCLHLIFVGGGIATGLLITRTVSLCKTHRSVQDSQETVNEVTNFNE